MELGFVWIFEGEDGSYAAISGVGEDSWIVIAEYPLTASEIGGSGILHRL